jgi:EAL domain-containing protein (putative c-di-GMP-specific phosphodiesterase class I)
MDDFGTGYASLSSLQSFPFDKIKIDRSFISKVHSNQQSAAIVRAVIGLSKALNIPIIAEGVETEREREFLRNEGCREIQGYLVGRRQPIANYWTSQAAFPRASSIAPRLNKSAREERSLQGAQITAPHYFCPCSLLTIARCSQMTKAL